MTPALQQFDMVALTVPHEHLPAGSVGCVLDIYCEHAVAHCQFRETTCEDGFDESVEDLVMVPLAHLRPAEASDYPAEPVPAPLTADEAMKTWADASDPRELAAAVNAIGLTFEEQFDALFPNSRIITLDFEAGEMMELLRSAEGRAILSAVLDEAARELRER